MYLVVEQPGQVPVGAVRLLSGIGAARIGSRNRRLPLGLLGLLAPLEDAQLLHVDVVHLGHYAGDPGRGVPAAIQEHHLKGPTVKEKGRGREEVGPPAPPCSKGSRCPSASPRSGAGRTSSAGPGRSRSFLGFACDSAQAEKTKRHHGRHFSQEVLTV